MSRPFLDERLELCPGYGTSYGEHYDVDNQATAGSASRPPSEYARLRHPYPRGRFALNFQGKREDVTLEQIIDLYHRCGGTYGAFRVRHRSDYSTNNYRDEPTAADQILLLDVDDPQPHRYQLTRWYGTQGDTTATRRRILKPVSGSVLVGIRDAAGVDHAPSGGYTVDESTGTVTYSEHTQGITDITRGTETEIATSGSPGYSVGDSVIVTDVASMTEINGIRAAVTAVTSNSVTLAINSNGFTDYVPPSEGTDGLVSQAPQADLGEYATAGCYFDLPVRFETDLADATYSNWDTLGTTVQLVELLSR